MSTKFKAGDKVRVHVGEYKGLEAKVLRVVDDWDVRYRIEVTNSGIGWGWHTGSVLIFDEARLEALKPKRVVGEKIDAKNVLVGDTVRLEHGTDAYGQKATYEAVISEVHTDSNDVTRLYTKGTSRGLFHTTSWNNVSVILVAEGPDPKDKLLQKLKDAKANQVITFKDHIGVRVAQKRNYLSVSVWDVFRSEQKAEKLTAGELVKILPLDTTFLTEPAA